MGVSKGYHQTSPRLVVAVMLLIVANAISLQAEFRAAPLRISSAPQVSPARISPVQNVPPATSYHAAPVANAGPDAPVRDLSAPIGRKRSEFFDAGSAATTFQRKVQINPKPQLEYFPVKAPTKEDLIEATPVAEASPSEEAKKKSLETSEGILKAFGGTEEEDPIYALDAAPAPFKGMTAALQIGDEALAAGYARRYARYLRNLKERASTSVGVIGAAMQEEGMLPRKGSWMDTPQFSKERQIMRENAGQDTELNREISRVATLDPKTKEFLERAQEAEEMDANPKDSESAPNAQVSEEAQRAEIRRALNGKVPVDPNGEIDVFFFFRPYDRNSLEMVPEIEALYRAIATKGGINFMASTFETMSPDDISAFHSQTNTTFPIKNGQRLVREFQVKSPPTVVVVSRSTSRAVFEEGKRNFMYLDELTKIMRGQ